MHRPAHWIARAARQAEFPARFQLIAAMNPCPCGYLGDPSGRCRCTEEQVQRYRGRISGPLLDRIDLQIEVPRMPFGDLQGPQGEKRRFTLYRTELTEYNVLPKAHTCFNRLDFPEFTSLSYLRQQLTLVTEMDMSGIAFDEE